MNKTKLFIESFNNFSKSDDEIVMRMNYKHSTRCPHCGRCLSRIHKLPATRTCPNSDCGSRYEISKSGRGLKFVRQYL